MSIEGSSTDPVSFLFTDIESSTRRWENDADGMARDLALHDEILRSEVEAAGGTVFGHTGDGMCAAFPAEAGAVRAALAAQRELAGADWSGVAPLRVRMAVHSGPAQRRAGNYFGPTLNRAARLMAAGAGGQVLCSQAAAVRLADGAAPGIVLVDLGEHRLADLGRAERVYQVSEPSTPAVFPPLRSLGAHRHNLPVAPDAFVGRAVELAELDRLLEGTRLLSLLGAGGSGKTRLALHLAAGAVERFADGVWLVELASLRDDALVPSAAAAALGLDTTGYPTPQALVEHLGSWLAPKRILLLIDNCEHLIDAAAQLIHDLLARCPQLSVLATSREVLGVPGETAWRVPPLSVPAEGMADPSDLAA
ncbi:MAG TPA: AAA family ATPase, partial [Sporichthya sp.]|nr:AAA family ATPase [Sporichthya sp.]